MRVTFGHNFGLRSNLHSGFELRRWRWMVFLCLTDSPPPPPPPLDLASTSHSVALLRWRPGSFPVQPRRVEPSVRMSTSVGRTSNAYITSIFFFFSPSCLIKCPHISPSLSVGMGPCPPPPSPSTDAGGVFNRGPQRQILLEKSN